MREEKPNISDEILKSALARGLAWTCTGGEMDFVTRQIGEKSVMALVAVGDAGSPDTLDEPAGVALYVDEDDWSNGPRFTFGFDEAAQAMDFMAGPKDGAFVEGEK